MDSTRSHGKYCLFNLLASSTGEPPVGWLVMFKSQMANIVLPNRPSTPAALHGPPQETRRRKCFRLQPAIGYGTFALRRRRRLRTRVCVCKCMYVW